MPSDADDAIRNNRETVAGYDAYARQYAENTVDSRSQAAPEGLRRLIETFGPGARVLEIGSGPGWDADTLEERGLHVRRTDVSEGFIAVQAERGRHVAKLDLITDPLGGPHDAIVMLYVLHHIDRPLVRDVLSKIAGALRPGGALLMSFQEGEDDEVEVGESGARYHITRWTPDAMTRALVDAGLAIDWSRSDQETETRWMTLIASTPST